MYVLGFLAVRQAFSTVCVEAPCTLRQQLRHTEAGEQVMNWDGPPIGFADPLRPDQVEALGRLGLTLDQYGWLAALQMGIPVLVYVLIAAGLFWRKSDDWMVLLVSTMVMMFPLVDMPLSYTLAVRQPAWEWVAIPADFVAVSVWFIWPLVFPTGHFVPRWARWKILFDVAFAAIGTLGRYSILGEPPAAGNFAYAYVVISFCTSAYAQLYRYFRVASPLERQQIKWVVVGLAGFISIGVMLVQWNIQLIAQAGSMDPARALMFSTIPDSLFRTISLFIPVSIAISVLRYRLWDIDILINRTLVYGALTGLLALIYIGSVVTLQRALQALTGQAQGPLVTVVSTLALAALFVPLRRRVQAVIDQRFYRRKYDAARTLAAFSQRIRDDVDLQQLTADLVSVVDETMQSEQVSIWLKVI
jgi:hypothetical protein